jgi:hypothetical protein
VLFIVALNGGCIRLTAIDGDLVGHAVAMDRLGEKAERGLGIPVLREQKVNGLAGLIDRSVQVPPLAFHSDIGLIHPPAASHWALAAVERLFQLGTVLHDPALDGRVVDWHPALLHQFFDMPITQGIRHIPPYTHQNNILWEMGTLEAHRHRLSPSLATTDHGGRSYRKSPQMKTCDRTENLQDLRPGAADQAGPRPPGDIS